MFVNHVLQCSKYLSLYFACLLHLYQPCRHPLLLHFKHVSACDILEIIMEIALHVESLMGTDNVKMGWNSLSFLKWGCCGVGRPEGPCPDQCWKCRCEQRDGQPSAEQRVAVPLQSPAWWWLCALWDPFPSASRPLRHLRSLTPRAGSLRCVSIRRNPHVGDSLSRALGAGTP